MIQDRGVQLCAGSELGPGFQVRLCNFVLSSVLCGPQFPHLRVGCEYWTKTLSFWAFP